MGVKRLSFVIRHLSLKITLLGTGTSTGVPMVACDCTVCRSDDPRDKRLRVSVLIEHEDKNIVIDTSADFREQMLRNNVRHLEAVIYTHHHYDHIAGFDDLRAFQFLRKKAPTCYADAATADNIKRVFNYAFGAAMQKGGGLPEVPVEIIGTVRFDVLGLNVIPIPLLHGKMPILGFRIGSFAYLTDCSKIPSTSMKLLRDLDVLVLDGLRHKPHPTHLSIEESVKIADKLGARMTYLTHMNHDILHARDEKHLPSNVRFGYDGLSFVLS
jgi:phosphoribosyl 1,2-cyclic phosphate phosphodiesterase